MNTQSLSSTMTREAQSDIWQQKYRNVVEKLANFQHENKKIDIEIRKDLEFERKRANQFEQKYKKAIKYQNQQQQMHKILNQLNQALKHKQNQIIQYIKADQQKKRQISELHNLNQQLSKANDQIRQQLNQIQQGAISALLQKDNIIQLLQQKISSLQNIDAHGLETTIIELQQKYKQLQDQTQAQKKQIQDIIEMKDEEIKQIREKFQIQRQRYEDKINLLQQQLTNFEKHVQKINEEKSHQENLQEKYYILQEKNRKTQKRLLSLQLNYKSQKQDLLEATQRLQSELATKNEQTQQMKNLLNKVKQLQKQIKNKKKQIEDQKNTFQKSKNQFLKRISQLEQEKKKTIDSLQIKTNQMERLKRQSQLNIKKIQDLENFKQQKLNKQIKQKNGTRNNQPTFLGKHTRSQTSEQTEIFIKRLKKQIKQLQAQIYNLNTKLEGEMKQVQSLRQKLVSKSGSAGRSVGQAKFLVQIQDMNSYIKKMEHNLMLTKLKYAQDQSHWSMRQSQLKRQLAKLDIKSKKQKAQLMERIERMKKSTVKDKKNDYYQSFLK